MKPLAFAPELFAPALSRKRRSAAGALLRRSHFRHDGIHVMDLFGILRGGTRDSR
jgi:hypothetical protein